MMRRPHYEKAGMEGGEANKGAWSKEEDEMLISYIHRNGEGCWRTIPEAAGLQRCGKSCRLRWVNYLKPGLKRGNFTPDEEDLIIKLHALLGNRWSLIAGRLPGRTDNEVKNYWNTHVRRKLVKVGIDPNNHRLKQTLALLKASNEPQKPGDKVLSCSKSSLREKGGNNQVSDSGSCLLEDHNSAINSPQLPDLNLDLNLSVVIKTEQQQGIICPSSPTLVLFA